MLLHFVCLFVLHVCVCAQCCSTFVNQETVAYQAPLNMEFFRLEYWGGCHFFIQGIFPTQEWNLCLLHLQAESLLLRHQGSPQSIDVRTFSFLRTLPICSFCPQYSCSHISHGWLCLTLLIF